jgi:hypothetical protein
MAYTDVDLVCSLFPTFKRGTPQQNPADTEIETYIEANASKLNGVLLKRFGESIGASTLQAWLGALPNAADAHNVLEQINMYGAACELVDLFAAYGVSGVRDLAARLLMPTYDKLLTALTSGQHDKLFDRWAATATPRPTFQGIAGAETDGSTPQDRGENRKFGIDDVF